MKKIIFIFVIFPIFLFSNMSKKDKFFIKNNTSFSCNVKENVVILNGDNFTGSYYKGKPYGIWELKNKIVQQCFLNDEKKYYYKGKYYIVDNPHYYLKINYQEGSYALIDKKRRILYFKNEKPSIQGENALKDIKFPKPLYDLMHLNSVSHFDSDLEDWSTGIDWSITQ